MGGASRQSVWPGGTKLELELLRAVAAWPRSSHLCRLPVSLAQSLPSQQYRQRQPTMDVAEMTGKTIVLQHVLTLDTANAYMGDDFTGLTTELHQAFMKYLVDDLQALPEVDVSVSAQGQGRNVKEEEEEA